MIGTRRQEIQGRAEVIAAMRYELQTDMPDVRLCETLLDNLLAAQDAELATLRQQQAALVKQWREEADELDAATNGEWIEPAVKRGCAYELAKLASPDPQEGG